MMPSWIIRITLAVMLLAAGWLLNDWAHQSIHALGRDVQPAFTPPPATGVTP